MGMSDISYQVNSKTNEHGTIGQAGLVGLDLTTVIAYSCWMTGHEASCWLLGHDIPAQTPLYIIEKIPCCQLLGLLKKDKIRIFIYSSV